MSSKNVKIVFLRFSVISHVSFMSLIVRSPSCNEMDLANYFALIFKLKPSINAIRRAKLLYRYV